MAQAANDANGPVLDDEASDSSKRLKLIIGAVVLIGALGYFGFMAFQGATVYYYTVSEINDVGPTPVGKMVRVSGKLIPTSFERSDGSTVANFALTDGAENMTALHDGVLPDLFFNAHSEIILEGALDEHGTFSSQNVIVKCPSKYVDEADDQELPAEYQDS